MTFETVGLDPFPPGCGYAFLKYSDHIEARHNNLPCRIFLPELYENNLGIFINEVRIDAASEPSLYIQESIIAEASSFCAKYQCQISIKRSVLHNKCNVTGLVKDGIPVYPYRGLTLVWSARWEKRVSSKTSLEYFGMKYLNIEVRSLKSSCIKLNINCDEICTLYNWPDYDIVSGSKSRRESAWAVVSQPCSYTAMLPPFNPSQIFDVKAIQGQILGYANDTERFFWAADLKLCHSVCTYASTFPRPGNFDPYQFVCQVGNELVACDPEFSIPKYFNPASDPNWSQKVNISDHGKIECKNESFLHVLNPTCRTTVNPVETRMDEIRLDVIPVVEPCRKSPGQHKVRLRSASTKQNKPRACPPGQFLTKVPPKTV
ncbi:unnamed protein product [Mesocestoides corti]|uniref:Uncharacterized protein n=1 Tax=Mesocestoides corti TaxID=53468 RepID=A0A158QTZ9_MESCO|nr:unnamed protein product [Mesocestoides corti]